MSSLTVNRRDFSIKPKQLRRKGLIPGSVFGGSLTDAVSLQIEANAIRKLLADNRIGSRCDIELDGKSLPVQIKEISTDPVSGAIQNISFQALKVGHKVNSVVHIILENTDKIKATLEQMITEIPYSSLPKYMIDTVTIDVDGMPEGTVVTVADIKELQSENLELQVNPEEIVFRIVEKISIQEEPAETEETAEETSEN